MNEEEFLGAVGGAVGIPETNPIDCGVGLSGIA